MRPGSRVAFPRPSWPFVGMETPVAEGGAIVCVVCIRLKGDEEREFQKGRLALAFRIFAKFGFDEGVAGHITLRVSLSPHEKTTCMERNWSWEKGGEGGVGAGG